MKKTTLILLALLALAPGATRAQVAIGNDEAYHIDYLTPKQYEIGGIEFDGADHFDHRMILMVAGLQVGDKITVPGDKIATAIDNLWRQGYFEDIQITVTRIQSGTVFLKIILRERPKMSRYTMPGISGDDAKKLQGDMHISAGDVVTENMLQTSCNIIRSFYNEKGFTKAEVYATTTPDTAAGPDRVIVNFHISKGKRVKIDSLIFLGNEQVPTKKLVQQMKNTHDVRYWRRLYFWTGGFWKRSKYREAEFEEDLSSVIAYYNELGYRDARIVSDTIFDVPADQLKLSKKKKAKQDRSKVIVRVHEGQQFYFRNITFAGNTVYPSDLLYKHLRIEKGQPYNKTTLETNLTYNPAGTDITSLYMDNGYLFFRVYPVETMVEGDSIDIEIRIDEGKQARIRNVSVEGNTVTNDKIIMRELHTRPGDLFSRDAMMRSYRELVTLGYFKQETLKPEPRPNAKDGTVDIVYKVEENSTSQIMLQGGYGSGMFIGQLGLQLNNFSARNIFNRDQWAPLPAGDGQKLGINFVTNGSHYYAFSTSFTEPWLGGKRPQAFSVSAYANKYSNGIFTTGKDDPDYYSLAILGGAVSLGKRLKWPDDYFTLSHMISYRHYTLNNYGSFGLPFTDGVANEVAYTVTLGRNSFDSPIYTRSGSEFVLEGHITPPFSLLNGKDYSEATPQDRYRWLEYFKVNLRGSWNLNLLGDLVLNARFRLGYMGYFNKQIGLSPFGRYYLGGDGLQSYMFDGREVIPLRGYDNNALSPTDGAGVFDRFTIELKQPIIESAATTIWVLGFFEGGNSWNSITQFQPFKLYNSAGVGVRLYMPMMGMLGVDWGYGLDTPATGSRGGSHFHFSIGQSLD